jgi:hypothetical protein
MPEAIPENEEKILGQGASPYAYSSGPGYFSLGRYVSFAARDVEAGALRGLGTGPTPLQRCCVAALLREVLRPVVGPKSREVMLHGLLLPALHMQVSGPRLSLSMETAGAVKSLLCDSPANQAAAYKAGVVGPLVKVSKARGRWYGQELSEHF